MNNLGPWGPYPSSDGKTEYFVHLRPDGVLACPCRGWIIRRGDKSRTCSHSDDVVKKMKFNTENRGEFRYVLDGPVVPTLWEPDQTPIADKLARARSMGYVQPMLACKMPTGKDIEDFQDGKWYMEEKFNGQRCIVAVKDARVRCWSRPSEGPLGLERPPLTHAESHVSALPDLTADTEEFVPGEQHQKVRDLAFIGKQVYMFFDLVIFEGKQLHDWPIEKRRGLLKDLLAGLNSPFLLFSEGMPVSRKSVQKIWDRGGEGGMIKRLGSAYREGVRSADQIKVKLLDHTAWQIIGFEAGKNGPYSVLKIRDANGVESACKARGSKWLREFAAHPEKYLDQWMILQHHGRTPEDKPVNPVFDHIKGAEEK